MWPSMKSEACKVLREHAGRGVRKAEARIERVVGVVAEVHVTLEREIGDAAGAVFCALKLWLL